MTNPQVLPMDNEALARMLRALACDCDSTDGWEDAAPDLRLAAHRLSSSLQSAGEVERVAFLAGAKAMQAEAVNAITCNGMGVREFEQVIADAVAGIDLATLKPSIEQEAEEPDEVCEERWAGSPYDVRAGD